MVYKKYIIRNGKSYGPYIYNSRRVNGKVISEYHGTGKKDYKKFAFLFLGILILAVSVFIFLNSNGKISGNVVSDNQIVSQSENVLINELVIYPKVYFTLILTPKVIPPQEINNIPEQENTNSETDNSEIEETTPMDSSIIQEPVSNLPESSNDSEPTPTIETPLTTPEQTTPETSEIIPVSETPVETTTSTDSSTIPIEQTDSTTTSSESTTEEETTTQTTSETNSEPPTENAVSQILETVSNFFLGFLRTTGMAVSESNSIQIKGEVSVNNSFSYQISEGDEIKLLPGSVKTNSKSLSDETIKIIYEGNNILISTDYSEKISNETKIQKPKVEFNIEPLSEKERETLNSALGNYSVQITKSEIYNGRYVVEYQTGDYNIKHSYDSDLNNETLNYQMENDKTKWLRDIANQISNA